MTTVFWRFNSLLEMAATPQQRPGNALVTNIPENSKDELQRYFYDIDRNRSTKKAKNHQSTNRREN